MHWRTLLVHGRENEAWIVTEVCGADEEVALVVDAAPATSTVRQFDSTVGCVGQIKCGSTVG